MSKKGIKLGDEIEDVTSKTIGIATGKVIYLSGQIYWIIHVALKEVYVPDAYCKYKGPGVYPSKKPPMGFRARDEQ
jgi:hypothetical protein